MSNKLKPVYNIQQFHSEVNYPEWKNLDQLTGTFNDGWIVLWQHHGVFVGEVKGGGIKWLGGMTPETGDEHLVRLRIFDEFHEYHFWRTQNGIKGRLRLDKTGTGTDCIDTTMVLRGVAAEPLQKASASFNSQEPISLQTRNYIEYHPETQQAGYIDCRFVDFHKKNN